MQRETLGLTVGGFCHLTDDHPHARNGPFASINRTGGMQTFAARAKYDWVFGYSRHSNVSRSKILSAVRKAAMNPKLTAIDDGIGPRGGIYFYFGAH